ncbi:MAG: hypothetical protein ACRCX2_37820 [Paraclostridium sp.]
MTEELKFIEGERKLLQEKYFKEAKKIWTEFEGIEADKKHRKAYKEYQNKDKFLEVLEAKIKSNIDDLDYYKGKL